MINKFLKHLMYLSVAGRLKKFEASLENPAEAQRERFEEIVLGNKAAEFGKQHSFCSIKSIQDYKKAVPIRDYSGFKPYIDSMLEGRERVLVDERIDMFGVTSGSTAEPKYIPVTRSFTVEYHNSHLLWMYSMVKDRNDGVVGNIFSMVSPAVEGYTPSGVPFGSSSGKQYRDQSIPIRAMHPIPYTAFLIDDIKAKYHVALVLALRKNIRVVNSVNPSTLVMIAEVLAGNAEALIDDIASCTLGNAGDFDPEMRQELEKCLKPVPQRVAYLRGMLKQHGTLTPALVWPEISAINTWQGGNAPFYLGKVSDLWGEAPQRCLGLRATEGMFTIPLEDYTPYAPLAVNGHFMEFVEDRENVKEYSDTLLAHELEAGKRYRLIITTSSGLYRYDLGDVVEVRSMRKNTPEVAFIHKAGGVLSLTGEKVYEDQVVSVMSRICRSIPYEITGFSVTVEAADNVRYSLIVELLNNQSAPVLKELAVRFDLELSKDNIEYREKRKSGRLGEPFVIVLEKGAYAKYRNYLVAKGRPDGQIKPPHILKYEREGLISSLTHDFFRQVGFAERID